MAVDATMRPLKIPPKFVPYLEAHSIYELFYEMMTALIKYRPDDTVQFLRDEMTWRKKAKNPQKRVIFIAPIHINLHAFANSLADENTSVITLDEIVEKYSVEKREEEPIYDPQKLALATRKHVESKKSKGWLLVGFPRTKEEAKALQKNGVLPTHTLELIHDPKDYAIDDLWNENLKGWDFEQFHSMLTDYRRRALQLREAYKSTYKRVVIRGRPMDKLTNDCKFLLRKIPHKGAPMLPRVVLIGAKGSRRRVIAQMLHERFKLVHVHFWSLILKASAMDDNLGDEIRHTAESINIFICLKLLEDRLLEEDCINHGWVLTGFPNDETDLQALENLDVRPNRIIFLAIPHEKCMERLKDRRINMYTGEVMSSKGTAKDPRMKEQLALHPDDCVRNIEIEHEVYSAEIQSMMDYCEHRSAVIKATGSIQQVFERVESAIINPRAVEKRRTLEPSQSLYNQFSDRS